jgi:5'-deoxynucleotidase YfbR-like HD superfamily hydrolase
MIYARIERLQTHINTLTALKRNHYLPGTDSREDDTSHAYSVALIAWQLNEAVGAGLDDAKLLKYALIHDFVEVHAGDVCAFASPEARRQKEIDEAAALERLREEYADAPDFIAAIDAYQAHEDDTVVFVWSCDKMQALLQGQLDNWRCYYELGITDEQFAAKIAEQRPRIHPALLEFYDEFCASCIATYHYEASQDTLF